MKPGSSLPLGVKPRTNIQRKINKISESVTQKEYIPSQPKVSKSTTYDMNTKRIAHRNVNQEDYENKMASLDEYYITHIASEFYTYEKMEELCSFNVEISKGGVGIKDEQFGSTKSTEICKKCKIYDCPGHWGLLTFPTPILNHNHISTLRNMLTVACPKCGILHASKEDQKRILRYPPDRRMKMLTSLKSTNKTKNTAVKGKDFMKCNAVVIKDGKKLYCESQYKILPKKDRPESIFYKNNVNDAEIEFLPKDVERFINLLSDEAIKVMGLHKREYIKNYVMKGMPILPSKYRMEVKGKSKDMEDKLTIALTDIIKACYAYNEDKLEGKNEKTKMIYMKVKTYYDEIKAKVNGKEGLARAHALGKRGDQSGRAVISPAGDIAFGEVIIPAFLASILTTQVFVTETNLESLQKLLYDGKVNYVTKAYSGKKFKVTQNEFAGRSNHILEPGDLVERWLQNGDNVVIARQPILNKDNLMSFKAVIQDGRYTIGIHISHTPPFHADFDGDTVSIWVPQSEESKSDCDRFMSARRNIMSYQNSSPIMGLVYNAITAAYILTLPSTKVSPSLIASCHNKYVEKRQLLTLQYRLNKYNINRFSGAALFSSLLPADFNYTYGSEYEAGKPNPKHVRIIEGILVTGTLTKGSVGAKGRSIVQDLYKYQSSKKINEASESIENIRYNSGELTSNFITDADQMLNTFLDYFGFSIGIRDCQIAYNPKLTDIIDKGYDRAELETLCIKKPKGKYEIEAYEKRILSIVNKFKGINGEVFLSEIDGMNSLLVMSELGAGTKGQIENLSKMFGALGQQNYAGGRIEPNMSDNQRCFVTDIPGDTRLSAKGFCKGNYFRGLSPIEYLNHAIGAREGLSDTATKTPVAGELQRKLRCTQENQITTSGAVIAQNSLIVQFVYGGDGFDATELLKVGNGTSFISIKSVCDTINSSYGWVQEYTKIRPEIEITRQLQLKGYNYEDIVEKSKSDEYKYNRVISLPSTANDIIYTSKYGLPFTLAHIEGSNVGMNNKLLNLALEDIDKNVSLTEAQKERNRNLITNRYRQSIENRFIEMSDDEKREEIIRINQLIANKTA